MHKKFAAADHARKEIRDEFDNEGSTVLCALVDGEVIATIRLTWGGPGLPENCRKQFSLDRFRAFPIETIGFTSRLVVHKDWRGTPALGLVFSRGYELSGERGCRINFCHCTPALVKLYEQVGYRRYTDAIVDPDVGYHIPLVMLTEDVEHLRRVGSPLLAWPAGGKTPPRPRSGSRGIFLNTASAVPMRYCARKNSCIRLPSNCSPPAFPCSAT